MTLRASTALRTKIIDTGINDAFDTDGRINFYSGAQPASADAASTGTLLATVTLPADVWAAAVTGTATGNAITDVSVATSGTVGWFRIYKNADSPSSAVATLRRLDGAVTATGGGGDMTFDVIAWLAGGTIHINNLDFSGANWA
jgi:hypothetical protein